MARPTKYTPDVEARIVQGIELGLTYELAAAYGGIAYETFNEWRKSKQKFSDLIKAAEGRAAAKWMAIIERAATEDRHWQAAAWKLERRYPQEYGKTVQEQQVTGKDGGPIRHEIGTSPDLSSVLTLEQRFALDQILAAAEDTAR